MKALRTHLVYLIAIVVLVSWGSLSFAEEPSNKIKTKVSAKTGNEVTLFYSGGGDIKEVFPIGSVLQVYRRNVAWAGNYPQKAGQVEVVSYVDENHFKGKLVGGKVSVGDVLKLKPTPECPAAMVAPAVKQ